MSKKEKVNILLVDDQPAKLLSYEVILGELGENLIKARSGKEALEYLLKTDVAVVLMDVSMPELDGFELAELIRQHPRYQKTAIIFVSAVHLTDIDRLRGYQHGAVDYVSVPVVPEILRAKVGVFVDLYRKTQQLERLNRELEQRVTERTAALDRERELLQKIFDKIPVMIVLYRPDTRVLQLNQEFERVTGWSTEEARQGDLMARCYPDPTYREEVQAFMESAQEGWKDIVMTTREGQTLQTMWSNLRLSDETQVGIGVDITERKRAEESQKLLTEVRERNRLAHELHDNVAQALGYLNLKTTLTLDLLANNQLDEVEANLRELKQIALETYADIRSEIFNLRASPRTTIDFLETLRQYVDKYKRFYNLDIQLVFEADEACFNFPSEVGIPLIRTIQEALMNVRKHAQVDQAHIRLGQTANDWRISVEDKGRGFDLSRIAAEQTANYGVKIMHERVEGVGGHIEIKSVPGRGTQITLLYPKG
ncbi:MAG: response regulator [Anaerolineales bacterium]|nr:response regulator [Anaerolineales bacterium]